MALVYAGASEIRMSEEADTWFSLLDNAQCYRVVDPPGRDKVGAIRASERPKSHKADRILKSHQLVTYAHRKAVARDCD
jgi:hypothetical protein